MSAPPSASRFGASLPGYLPALDGLRALSVLSVIAHHADLPYSSGGILGVEVFFVVSGYLITSLLLREQRRCGCISLTEFWLRRARRLLPALITLLLATLALSLTLATDSLGQTRSDCVAALLYVSNWWQVLHHHSYFMLVDRPPLLLHLWSLAVEEQFYIFWPLAVTLIGRRAGRWVLPVALLAGTLSALWMWLQFDPSIDPTRVYVGTDTRASGLLLGAALAALLEGRRAGTGMGTGTEFVSWIGLGGLILLGVQVSSHGPFLYRGGLVLVDLASCALIAGLVAPTAVARVLGTRPLAWLGRRSYGLYLWHWPVFAVTRPEFDLELGGLRLFALRALLTYALSELCYRFVETPIRGGALSRLRARPLLLGATATLLAAGLVSLSGAPLAVASKAANSAPQLDTALPAALEASVRSSGGALYERAPSASVALGVRLDPTWPKTLTLLSDSVGLGLSHCLSAALPDWKVEVLGRPALMVKQVVPEFLNARSVGSVVVVALAYNSLFEKDRQNHERWRGIWDHSAEKLVSDLGACGAKKLVWVTLREPSPELVDDAGRDQYQRYAWYFPYVNERIRALSARHPELAIADWQAVSDVPGLTKDLIHLNPAGATLMTKTVTHAVLGSQPSGRATPPICSASR